MPNWFQATIGKVGHVVDGITDNVMDKVGDALDGLDDLGPAVERLKDAGMSSNTLAKETTELCLSTHDKSLQMMEFCQDLKETLATSTEGGIAADTLDTIQDLLSGEKVQSAMGLAKEMSAYAKTCVEKSVQMVSTVVIVVVMCVCVCHCRRIRRKERTHRLRRFSCVSLFSYSTHPALLQYSAIMHYDLYLRLLFRFQNRFP